MKRLSVDVARSTLDALQDLKRTDLVARWQDFYCCPAPRHASMAFLKGAIAWECQCALQPQAAAALRRALRALRRSGSASPLRTLTPGTQLLREWQGVTHRVTVAAEGFVYAGRTYRSLSVIAGRITGSARSGPLFFGLKR